jgi:hypothetical protein
MASSTKRAREEEAAALDLSQPPKNIAEQLLSCLGADANEQSKEAKNLDQAMRLVRKELSARGSRQQRAAEQLGSQSALTMRGAALPSDVFEHVAAYVAPKHYGALMATQKAFLSAVQAPRLWRRALDASEGSAMNVNCKISLKALLAELKRPRYGALEVLVLPRSIKFGKTGLTQLAKCLPDLKALDFGFSASNLHPQMFELDRVATELTSLVSIRTDMWNVMPASLCSLSATMGTRLLDFRVADDAITKHYFTDLVANALAQNCPNLKRLTVMGGFGDGNYEPDRDQFTVTAGLSPLLYSCASLERLELICKGICHSGFEPIAALLESMRAANRALPPLKVFTMAPTFARFTPADDLVRDRIRAIVPSFDDGVDGFTYTQHGRWAQEAADD